MVGWTLNQFYALFLRERFPGRLHIVRAEDVMADSYKTLSPICQAIGVSPADSLKTPSWNGTPLNEIYPWGTIRKANPTANKATAMELSKDEQDQIRSYTRQYLETFDYKSFLG